MRARCRHSALGVSLSSAFLSLRNRPFCLRTCQSRPNAPLSCSRSGAFLGIIVPADAFHRSVCPVSLLAGPAGSVSSFFRRLRMLWRHPWPNWWMLLRATGLTVLVWAGLSTVPLGRLTRALRRTARGLPHVGESTPLYRRRAAWAAQAVGRRFLPERPCLTQALVLQYLLLRRGDEAAELHIGATKSDDGVLQAHAWVERDGRVLIGGARSPDEYERFVGLSDDLLRAPPPADRSSRHPPR